MRTPKQTEASRANGAKSKGPITPQGKCNSSRNSTRHGLLAETVVLEAELASRFLELLDSLIEEHQPRTPTEAMLVDTIAAARWRQDRIWGMQKVAFDHDIASCDTADESSPLRAVLTLRNSPESVRTHELLLRYEIALDRQISRALLRLHQLQDRRAQERTELPASLTSNSSQVQKTAAAKRTQQPVEMVTEPPSTSAPILQTAVPPNRSAVSEPALSTSPTRKSAPIPAAAQNAVAARKKPAA
jgi:hypothetical protein